MIDHSQHELRALCGLINQLLLGLVHQEEYAAFKNSAAEVFLYTFGGHSPTHDQRLVK